jgi:hypothetical protein
LRRGYNVLYIKWIVINGNNTGIDTLVFATECELPRDGMEIIQLRVEKKSQHANTPTDHSVNGKKISRDLNRKTRKNRIPPIIIAS